MTQCIFPDESVEKIHFLYFQECYSVAYSTETDNENIMTNTRKQNLTKITISLKIFHFVPSDKYFPAVYIIINVHSKCQELSKKDKTFQTDRQLLPDLGIILIVYMIDYLLKRAF